MISTELPTDLHKLQNARIALRLLGFDATLKEVQDFVRLFSDEGVGEGDVNYARHQLRTADPYKVYDTKPIGFSKLQSCWL
jgi:hypothetical protein